jgi:ElaB/YqjD/DUF883 family membrane-anchored ribosome-binding protein
MATNESRENRSPEEIERELEQTRSDISRTIDAIQHKITPTQLASEAYGFVGGGTSDFVKNLGTAAKNNPIPVALVGLGLAWLAAGGGRMPTYLRSPRTSEYESASADGDESRGGASLGNAASATGEYARSAGQYAASAGQATAGAAGRLGRGLFRARKRVGERARGIGHSVGDIASGTSERVRQMADDVRDLASEWSDDAAELAEGARERMYRASDVVQEQSMRMRDNANDLLREQPLVVGALGLAVGAVLGALLPSTRRENEMLGETRDQLFDQAKQTGEQMLGEATEAVKDVASAATDAARNEAERQGLTGDSPDRERRSNPSDRRPSESD